MHGGAAELVDDDVGVLLGDEHVARAAVQFEGDLIRHRGRGQEKGALLAEQAGHALLELVHRRVLAHLLVADDGGCDGRPHAGGRPGNGVGAKIDHGRPLCMWNGGEAASIQSSLRAPGTFAP